MTRPIGDGIEELLRRRGDERVSFAEVADHLEEYRRRHPGRADAVEDLARFLARVEAVPHDHGGPAGSSADGPAGGAATTFDTPPKPAASGPPARA